MNLNLNCSEGSVFGYQLEKYQEVQQQNKCLAEKWILRIPSLLSGKILETLRVIDVGKLDICRGTAGQCPHSNLIHLEEVLEEEDLRREAEEEVGGLLSDRPQM
jgi:hypothetical protein